MIRNTQSTYGLVSITIHWIFAGFFYGLFFLGIWMVGLDYGHTWYYQGPTFHEGIGILFGLLLIFRWVWLQWNTRPEAEPGMTSIEILLAHAMHGLLYLLPLALVASGYFISAAGDRAIPVFDLFVIPSFIPDIHGIESTAGEIHEWVAYLAIALSVLHMLAAFKHHFVNKDRTLIRMLKVADNQS